MVEKSLMYEERIIIAQTTLPMSCLHFKCTVFISIAGTAKLILNMPKGFCIVSVTIGNPLPIAKTVKTTHISSYELLEIKEVDCKLIDQHTLGQQHMVIPCRGITFHWSAGNVKCILNRLAEKLLQSFWLARLVSLVTIKFLACWLNSRSITHT